MSEVLRYAPSATVTLSAALGDGATDQYPQAIVRQADGTVEATVNLTHEANGLYTGTFSAPATPQLLSAHFITYSDAGRTTENTTYGRTVSFVDVRAAEATAASVADAVWDEATADHVAAGSFGLALQDIDTSTVPAAVWNVTRTAVGGAGTMGEALKVLLGTAGQTNMRMDSVVLDANGFMTSARIRVFETSAAASASTNGGSGEGEIATITLTGTPDGTFTTVPTQLLGTG